MTRGCEGKATRQNGSANEWSKQVAEFGWLIVVNMTPRCHDFGVFLTFQNNRA